MWYYQRTLILELPDFLNKQNWKYFLQEWEGEVRFVSNIKLRNFTKEQLENLSQKEENQDDSESDDEYESAEEHLDDMEQDGNDDT